MTERRFKLAHMSGFIAGFTILLWGIPIMFAFTPLWIVGLFLVGLYAGVWAFMRPRSFVIGPRDVVLRFPARASKFRRADIIEVTALSAQQFKARFGRALRVGVGGLWGGFGWLWTSKGLVDFFISRTDGFVLIERRGHKPLLITPERPDEFVRALSHT